jgi:hypothetical protein
MARRKSINVTSANTANGPFSVSTKLNKDGKKLVYTVNARSVIYKSFNLKDIMVYEGFIDKETKTLIEAKEKNLKRHIIKSLSQEQDLVPDSIIYLELEISQNLNIISAEIYNLPTEHATNPKADVRPWNGFPEMIGFSPPLEFDDKGQLKNSNVSRYQRYAYVPIAYVTSDPQAVGTSITFPAIGSGKPLTQTLVQILNTNLIIQTFNYDGIPVAYPIPFFGGTYLYYDYTKA